MKLKKFIIIAELAAAERREISLNLALTRAREGKRTMLLDGLSSTPYFPFVGKKRRSWRPKGVRVVKPCFANTTVDVRSSRRRFILP